jgi:hypothetical protein
MESPAMSPITINAVLTIAIDDFLIIDSLSE